MIQLAIETSGRTGTLAILQNSTLLQSYALPSNQRTAASLAPALQTAIRWCEATEHPLDFVSVAEGPGSFTGLRIGVTTAKTLCYATGLPLVAVDSVAAVAALGFAQADSFDEIAVVINAYRGQVFAGHFQRSALLPKQETNESKTMEAEELALASKPSRSSTDSPTRATIWRDHSQSTQMLSADQWQTWLSNLPAQAAWCGEPGCLPPERQEHHFLHDQVEAFGVGLLGLYAARWQQWVDPLSLTPRYLKASAAEEQQDAMLPSHR